MEVLRRSRWVCDPHVLLRTQLEEALEASARVFRSLTLVSVREQQGETGVLPPFHQPRGEELVDHDLGHVYEVPELRLPKHHVGIRPDGVSILEADHRGLGQRRIVDLQSGVRDLL